MKCIGSLIFVASLTIAQSWNSRLLSNVNGTFTPQTVNFAARNWTLDDFSYAGYFLGAKSLGSVPCNVVNVTATGDITAAVEAAINTAGAAGGGIVRIPAGTFVMSSAVTVNYNNVSIEGAGSGQTIINVPSTYSSPDDPYVGDGLFTFGRTLGATSENDGWVEKGTVLTTATSVVHRGDMQISTANASQIKIGDWIVVQQFFWPALVNNNSSAPDQWIANDSYEFSFTYLRVVTAKTGNVVSIDAPIPWTLDPANNAVRIKSTDGQMKENVGIKGITINFANNTLASTGLPHGSGVYFEGVRDGWVYDVQVFNFPRNGIYVTYSARITILNSWVQTAQNTGGDGYGYGFLVSPAQNILIKGCHGEATRHNFITSHPQTSMIVETQNVSVNATQPDDTHFGFEQGILWDKHTQLGGEAIEAVNRGDESDGAYETMASGVIWNFYGDGVNLPNWYGGGIFLKPSPDGEMIVVGVTGKHTVYDNSQGNVSPFVEGQLMTANEGLQVGTSAGALQNVLYEGLYQTGLQPASLYEAQLANRIGTPPADWIDACGAAPVLTSGAVTNAASFAAGPLSPGEIVTLFGTGMGPASIVTATINAFGLVDNTLAGTRVLFDGVPAPLIYTRADTVSAVVPYATAGKSSTMVQVEYQGQISPASAFPIVPATPGVFELGASQWVLNQDGTINSPSNPAAAGSAVTLYATGGGQTNPAGVDGSLAAVPLPAPVAKVSLTIGGANASVLYAGAAPGLVAGLLQINVRVPAGLSSSSPAALVLNVGGASSQAGCTIAIK
ncbi:MAG TPA: hypothetical protein VK752_00235 [Bryobacteraceae bacterium]|jgi:uncharacterized protein (TIGR03437 family)|nr:hypothetical protein [Bryobacteraceae bacterium]